MGKRVADMTPDELARHYERERARRAGMTPEQRARKRGRDRARRAADPEKAKAKDAARYRASRATERERADAWRVANPEKARAYNAAWRAANPDKERARTLARYYANRDAINAKKRAKRAEQRRQQIVAEIPIMTAEGVLRLAPLRRRKTHLYVITCEPTGWLYVGLTTKAPDTRFRQHMSGGRSAGARVRDALTKFAPSDFSFQVLHTYANPTEAAHAETEVIAHLDLTGPAGMNTGRGGEGARRKKWIIEPIQDDAEEGEDC